jgi:hypothetical protein
LNRIEVQKSKIVALDFQTLHSAPRITHSESQPAAVPQFG